MNNLNLTYFTKFHLNNYRLRFLVTIFPLKLHIEPSFEKYLKLFTSSTISSLEFSIVKWQALRANEIQETFLC